MAITHRDTGARRCRRSRLAAALVALGVIAACAEDDRADPPLVVVPNEVLADLVQRVACVEPVRTAVGDDAAAGTSPLLTVTLDEPAVTEEVPAALTVSVPAVATTIDQPGPDDPWVWLDPTRLTDVARAVAGALASTGDFDPSLLDRCLARIDAEIDVLDQELFDVTQAIPDELRSIDVSAPGTIYFASRYEFLIDESETSVEAGGIISTDSLDGAESYDAMMRANVDRIVELLGSR
jgi:zinc/manganese transport system substrate-binding protein